MDLISIAHKILYALVIIFILLKKKKLGKHIEIVAAAMFATFAVETYTAFFQSQMANYNTTPYFVFVILGVVFTLFFYYFYLLIEHKTTKKILLALLVAHILNFVISAAVVQNFFTVFPQITNFISIILLLCAILIFFKDVFDSDRILLIKSYYPFWVGLSLIVVYLGILPVIIFGARIDTPLSMKIFRSILFTVNFLGYGIMLISIFLAKNTEKKS